MWDCGIAHSSKASFASDSMLQRLEKLSLQIRTHVLLTVEIQYTWSFACLLSMRATFPFFYVHMVKGRMLDISDEWTN